MTFEQKFVIKVLAKLDKVGKRKRKKSVDFKTCILDLKSTDKNADNQKGYKQWNKKVRKHFFITRKKEWKRLD